MRFRLVQAVFTEENLMAQARRIASVLTPKHMTAFANIKALLRKTNAEDMMKRGRESIREFVAIGYSEPTWANLQDIKIQ